MSEKAPLREVVAFDFDGTLTTHDTLLLFLRHAVGAWRMYLYMLAISPLLVLMKLHLYPNWKAKQRLFAHFFRSMETKRFHNLCLDFVQKHRWTLRSEGLDTLRAALNRGASVAIVSASIDDWVRPFFASDDEGQPLTVSVLGTQVEEKDGRLTGKFLTRNCYGAEKVRRLLALFPDRASYRLTAYGDSRGDRELLALADEAHYKPFRQS